MPSQPIALSLSQPPHRPRADALLTLAEHLLDLLSEHAPEDPALEAPAFRAQLDGWRRELRLENDAEHLARLVDAIARACGAFLDRTQAYRSDREAELMDLVTVLREVIDTVRGDSKQFESELIRSTTAMGRMVEIEDIRELKRALSREVQTLRQAVAVRQTAEAKHYEKLTSRVQSLEQSLVKAKAEAATDALTQLPNRGAFDLALREWVSRAARENRPFTVAMVDLDDFKRINDTYGHPVGDRVIVAAAQLLRGGVTEGEFASRFGGEEFALLLQTATAAKARDRITALLDRLPPSYGFEHDGVTRFVSVTFSGGVTGYVTGDTPESVIKRADEALYDAKRRGKKRVETRPQSFLRGLIR
ncbi:MAG: diguanylate cyclase [Acidobacteria bacterium]|nr:diguanylate cyclase [Acidobacteriota bacterium]